MLLDTHSTTNLTTENGDGINNEKSIRMYVCVWANILEWNRTEFITCKYLAKKQSVNQMSELGTLGKDPSQIKTKEHQVIVSHKMWKCENTE